MKLLFFLAGFVAPVVLLITGYVSRPETQFGTLTETHAWLWKSADAPVQQLPLAEPAVRPWLKRTPEGRPVVVSDESQNTQGFDPNSQRFTPVADWKKSWPAPPPEGYPHSAGLDGDAHLWLERRGDQQLRATSFERDGAWHKGPLAPDVRENIDHEVHAVRLSGARIAILSSRYLEPRRLYVAGESDAQFVEVPLTGKLWPKWSFVLAAAGDGDRLQLLTSGDNGEVFPDGQEPSDAVESIALHLIDVRSGAVTDGPAFPLPAHALRGWRPQASSVSGGGLLWIGDGRYRGMQHPHGTALGLLILLGEVIGIVALLRRAPSRPAFLAGAVTGLLIGVPAFLFFVAAGSAWH